VRIALLWGQLPGIFKRAGTAPRPSETVASRLLELNARLHIVGNAKIRFLPSRATAEMDAHEAPPDVRGPVIKWIKLQEEPRLLATGTYAVAVAGWEDLKSLVSLAKVNPYSRFIVEVEPEAPPEVSFTIFEALRHNPQLVFRDPAFHALRGQYAPARDLVVVGSAVYEADWRAVALNLRAPSLYGAPELGYVASGWFTPETDPYLWWARRVATFTVVELPPPVARGTLPPLPMRPPESLPLPRSQAGRGEVSRPSQLSRPLQARAKLAEKGESASEGGGEADEQESGEEVDVEELEAEGEL